MNQSNWIHERSNTTTKNFIQYEIDNEKCPLLPPDHQQCLQRGPRHTYEFETIDEARQAYKEGIKMKSSKHNQRKYLRGGLYKNLYFDKCNRLDVRDYGGNMNLNIKRWNGRYTFMQVRDLSHEKESLKVIKKFNETCSKDSSARTNSGDSGSMFAFGKRSVKEGDYISMRSSDESLTEYSIVARILLEKYFGEEVKEIIEADRNQRVTPSELMGGSDGLSAYCLVSMDLINAAHYDLDTSVSMTIFNERMIGKADDWYFVLPNTFAESDEKERSIIIQLFDGCAICWDGRKIFHSTATKEIHIKDGNHTYGNFWGGKKYN